MKRVDVSRWFLAVTLADVGNFMLRWISWCHAALASNRFGVFLPLASTTRGAWAGVLIFQSVCRSAQPSIKPPGPKKSAAETNPA